MTPTTPTPAALAAWQTRARLSAHGMADYLGIPVHTWRKWTNGTRTPDAAPCRLIDVLMMMEALAPDLAATLRPDYAAPGEPVEPRRPGRPRRSRPTAGAANASPTEPAAGV